jgi:V/A-type H+-transporting ATPase subunit B
MAAIVGTEGLAPGDRRALDFVDEFEKQLIHQGRTRRPLLETIRLGWSLLDMLPRDELTRISIPTWESRAKDKESEEAPE